MINPIAFRAVKRHFFAVHRKEILSEKLTQLTEKAAKASKDWVVAPHSILGLANVYNEQEGYDGDNKTNGKEKKQAKYLKTREGSVGKYRHENRHKKGSSF